MIPLVTALIPVIGKVIDNVFPDPEQADKAKARLMQMQQDGDLRELEAAARVVEAEAKSEHVITATWRPITMLALVGCVVAYWFGFTAPNLPPEAIDGLLDIVKIGLGGYVVGRSAEKAAKAWKK